MDYYVSKTSYAIEGNYKCYQKKYIQRFSVPQFTDDELTYLKNEPNMSSINQFLIEKYGLSDCCFANKLRKIFIQSAKKKRRLKGF